MKLISLAVKEEHGVKSRSVVLWPLTMNITVFHRADGDTSFLLNAVNFPPQCTTLRYRRSNLQRLKVFDDRVLRRIFGPKREK
jgi:hypothetical protein